MLDETNAIIEQILKPKLLALGRDIQLLQVNSDGVIKISIGGGCSTCPTADSLIEKMVVSNLQENIPNIKRVEISLQNVSDELINEGLKILRKADL